MIKFICVCLLLAAATTSAAEQETGKMLTNLLHQVNNLQVNPQAAVHADDKDDNEAKEQAAKINAITHVVADLRAKLEKELKDKTSDQVTMTKTNDGLMKQKQMHIVTLNAKIQRAKSELKPIETQLAELKASTVAQITMLDAVKKLVADLHNVNEAKQITDSATNFDHAKDTQRTADQAKHYKKNSPASRRRALQAQTDLMSKIMTAIQRQHDVTNSKGETVDFKTEVNKYVDEMIKSLQDETDGEETKYGSIIEGLQAHIVTYAEEIQTLEADINTLKQDNIILSTNLASRKKVVEQELQILALVETKLTELRAHYAEHREENRDQAVLQKNVDARNKIDNHQKMSAEQTKTLNEKYKKEHEADNKKTN